MAGDSSALAHAVATADRDERRWPSASPARRMTTLAMSGILVDGFTRSRDLVLSACLPPPPGACPLSWVLASMHHRCTTSEGQQGSAKVNKGQGRRAAELHRCPYTQVISLAVSALIMLLSQSTPK